MDLFRALEAIDKVTLSGVEADGWYIPEAKEAMEQGRMEYAGKYRAPDYELLLSRSCDLAIESTMIYHTPEVKEQLEDFGVTRHETSPKIYRIPAIAFLYLIGKEESDGMSGRL